MANVSKGVLKGLLYIGLSAAGLLLLLGADLLAGMRWEQHLPSDQEARREFDSHRREYVRFASILRQDPRVGIVGSDGVVSGDTQHAGPVAQYRDMMRSLGVKQIIVGEDGAIEFVLWGSGCAICSDSYKGLRYVPEDFKADARRGWVPKWVKSLDSDSLPQANGSVDDGLYVVPIAPGWFIYRLEIHE